MRPEVESDVKAGVQRRYSGVKAVLKRCYSGVKAVLRQRQVAAKTGAWKDLSELFQALPRSPTRLCAFKRVAGSMLRFSLNVIFR